MAYSLVLPATFLQESDMTKTFSVYAALLLLVLSLSACQTTVKRSDSIVERAIAAWNSHDPDKTVTAYTDDVVYEDVIRSEATSDKLAKFSPAVTNNAMRLWHPSRMREPSQPIPEVSAALRPPATLCQPCGLLTLDVRHAITERSAS